MPACAQRNPFSDSDEPFQSEASDVATSVPTKMVEEPFVGPDTPRTAQLLIRSIKQSDPKTPIELAKAVRIMLNVHQYEFAKYYLSRLQAALTDKNQKAQLVRELGSDFFLTLHATVELEPDGKRFARDVLAADRKFQESPNQLKQLIGRLNDPDIAVRSRAFRKLRRIGPKAIEALIEVFADGDQKEKFPGVRGALRSMGDSAIPLLRAAALAEDISVRIEALQALAHYRGAGISDVLASAVLNPAESIEFRASVVEAMKRNGYSIPDSFTLASQMSARADGLITGKTVVPGALSDLVTIWEWHEGTKKLEPSLVTVATASRVDAARLAQRVYQLDSQNPANRMLYLLTQLEVAKRDMGTLGELSVVDARKFYSQLHPSVGAVSPNQLNELLEMAVQKKSIQAATACCELLAQTGDAQVFYSEGYQLPPVIQAMMLGDRHLQHAALNVVDRLNPSIAYPGSSYSLRLAVFLSNTDQRAVALVGDHRSEVAQLYAGSLSDAGLIGMSASTSRDFFHRATSEPDVSLLLISDTLIKPRYDELVRQLRADFRTARTPIGLMFRAESRTRNIERLIAEDPLTFAFPIAVESESLVSHVLQLERLEDADLTTVSDEDRYRHAYSAAKWLAKVASDRTRFEFYELGPYQEPLAALLYLPGLEKFATEILSNLGTPMAQRELANFASQKSQPPQKRRLAAQGLVKSIGNGATLLAKDEIKRQYRRYNSSKNEPKEVQEMLGSILDSLEQRRDLQH